MLSSLDFSNKLKNRNELRLQVDFPLLTWINCSNNLFLVVTAIWAQRVIEKKFGGELSSEYQISGKVDFVCNLVHPVMMIFYNCHSEFRNLPHKWPQVYSIILCLGILIQFCILSYKDKPIPTHMVSGVGFQLFYSLLLVTNNMKTATKPIL